MYLNGIVPLLKKSQLQKAHFFSSWERSCASLKRNLAGMRHLSSSGQTAQDLLTGQASNWAHTLHFGAWRRGVKAF